MVLLVIVAIFSDRLLSIFSASIIIPSSFLSEYSDHNPCGLVNWKENSVYLLAAIYRCALFRLQNLEFAQQARLIALS